jgi:site-specific DNA recombinase
MPRRASVYGRQSSGKAKSINEQIAAGGQAINTNGWTHAGDYSDGTAASRFGTKIRSQWDRVIADVKAGAFDILILWESSRGDRTLSSWAEFLETCRKHKVQIYIVTDDHCYDLDRPRDWKTLAVAGVDAAAETDMLSIRVKRGHAGAAAEGKPGGGPAPFGYRRTYDPATGKRRGQEPCPHEAAVVREIFVRVATGHTILGLVNDLNERAVPRRSTSPWARCTIRELIRNRAYIGRRVLNGVEHQGSWEPIVDESVFFAAQEVLAQPERRKTRPGSQKHLLSYLGRCAVCDAFLNQVAGCYRCVRAGCVSIPKDAADVVVSEAVQGRLMQPNAVALLACDDREEIESALATASELRGQLDGWRHSAAKGDTSPASLAVIEQDLLGRIAEADVQSRTAQMSPLLREMLDPATDVRQRWKDMTVAARRMLVRQLCDIRVATGRPGRAPAGVSAVASALGRLGPSRWHGDSLTWGERNSGPS